MSHIESLRNLVLRAHHELFTEHDMSAFDRYFSSDFVTHSLQDKNSFSDLRKLVEAHPGLCHETHRVLQDGDLIAIHGRFTGLGEQSLIGFDLYRVTDDKIIEHWDGLVPEATPNASGRTQLDGPTEPGTGHDCEKNRALVTEFFTRTLIEGDYSGFRRYTDGKTFYQHSPVIADGVESVITFLNKLKANGQGLNYWSINRTIADGQFVLTHSEGSIAGIHHVYFELWRVKDNKVVELWDAIACVP